MNSHKIIKSAISAAIALTVSCQAHNGEERPEMERCYGVAKAGKNDCGAATHACAAQSTKAGDPNEWLYLPKGTCQKIVGGVTK